MRTLLTAILIGLAATCCHAELPVFAAVDELHEQARARIANGQYEALLADADRFLASRERIPDGRWKLAMLLGGVRRGLKTEAHSAADWARFDTAFEALARKHPASPDGWLLVAVLEDSHAWALRGGGYADTVSDDGQEGFARHLAKARATLQAHPAPSNPAWFELQISVAGALGENRQVLDRLFAAALKQEPAYQQTWFSRMMFLQPKWGGTPADMLALIQQAAQPTSPTEGRGMMSRLMRYAAESGYPEVLAWPSLDWETVKASFEDELKAYPDDSNAQWFFIQACTHGDRSEARHLLDFVKQPPSPILFGAAGFAFDGAAAWARGQAASFMMIDPVTGQPRRVRVR